MNVPAPHDTTHRVDAKIDAAVEQLKALSQLVDTVAEKLTRRDTEAVRQAFEAKEKGSDGG